MYHPSRDPRSPRDAGVVIARDEPWVLLYLPALDRLVWVDLDRVPYSSMRDAGTSKEDRSTDSPSG